MTTFKERVLNGETVLGSFAFLANPSSAEIMSLAGFDYVTIDMEHSIKSWETVENMVRAIQVAGSVPLVRVPSHDSITIQYALETGAEGVLVPMVRTAEQAQQVANASFFGPTGTRGACPLARPAGYGLNRLSFGSVARDINERVLVVVLIEDAEGVDNLEEIIATDPGPDVVFVGRSDLAASLGVPGERHHPLVEEQVDRIVELLRNQTGRTVIPGMQVHDPADLPAWRDRGFSFLSISSDTAIFSKACADLAGALK
jgi:2-keto-3-deoxy-L-rhamnonate aldolase RhmA